MGPKAKQQKRSKRTTQRGLLGVARYDSETDDDYVPYGSAAQQARKKRKARLLIQADDIICCSQ